VIGCWWPRPVDVCCVPGDASNAVIPSAGPMPRCARRAGAEPICSLGDSAARGAANPAICVPRLDGAGRVRTQAHRRTHQGSATCAASCAATRAAACARVAGSGIRIGRSCRASTSLHGPRIHRPGWTNLSPMSPRRIQPARACSVITALGRLLIDEQPNHPQALLDHARRPGRSLGPLARSLELLFTEQGLAMATDHAEQLAAGRRRRRIDAVPATLRPAVASFAESLLAARSRARRAGTLPRSDRTVDVALATLRDLALFLEHERGKHDWSTVDVGDIEAFLNLQPNNRPRRLTVLRQFFRFARTRRLVLIDPTVNLERKQLKGFRGRTLTIDQQRLLFRRWTTDPAVHPHESLVGILALLHGASSRELQLLRCDTIDDRKCTIRLDGRPHPVPLDPASWAVLARCLAHRQSQHTRNPHVIVTKVTKTGREPSSTAYLSHVLDACGLTPRTVRAPAWSTW
jgi:site-specific recombinase XerD